MSDIFISYTTRGLTTNDWTKVFCDDLKKIYKNNFNEDLIIWLAPREIVMSDNFRKTENDALAKIPMFLMILEPAYLESPETIHEKNTYLKMREDQHQPLYVFKVFRSLGAEEIPDLLKNIIDSQIISIELFKKNEDQNEEPLERGGNSYNNVLQNIAKAIRKIKKQQSQKLNSERFLEILEERKDYPKVYIAYSGSNDNRSKFINQLVKTIDRNDKVKDIKVFPDELILAKFTPKHLDELLIEPNTYGEACIKAMIKNSISIIVPIINDISAQAEQILKKLEFQIDLIEESFSNKTLPITIIASVPEEVYEATPFLKKLSDSTIMASENVKVLTDFNIDTFIITYINDIENIIRIERDPQPSSVKYIYIIEPYNPQDIQGKEIENRRDLRSYLVSKDFVLLPDLRNNAGLKEAAEYQKKMLNLSDGVIIYRGVTEDYTWCLQQQSDTFNTILNLDEEKRRKIKKAVYIDPLQENKERADYFYFNYEVIINPPPELDNFLWKIQQH